MQTEPGGQEPTFTIRQLCLEFKCTPRALRFYEDKGLLAPARKGQNRVYSVRDRTRLKIILYSKTLNLSLAEIGEILDSYSKADGGAEQSVAALRRYRERLVTLEEERKRLDTAIVELKASCERIETRLASSNPDLLSRAAIPTAQPPHRELASAG